MYCKSIKLHIFKFKQLSYNCWFCANKYSLSLTTLNFIYSAKTATQVTASYQRSFLQAQIKGLLWLNCREKLEHSRKTNLSHMMTTNYFTCQGCTTWLVTRVLTTELPSLSNGISTQTYDLDVYQDLRTAQRKLTEHLLYNKFHTKTLCSRKSKVTGKLKVVIRSIKKHHRKTERITNRQTNILTRGSKDSFIKSFTILSVQ